ncbi:MAG: hypothetical protein H7A36_06305 [Chlamydiales bacterium]|nr:hypothetical protein [Chlamydiales bacterium]
MKNHYPQIATPFDSGKNSYSVKAVERMLMHMFPPTFFLGEEHFRDFLPAVCWTPLCEVPFHISFFLCAPFRQGAYRFFYEMISHWLIPGRRLNVLLQCAVDFTLPQVGSELYLSGEIMIEVRTKKELELLEKNLPIVEREILLGIHSPYHATRLLETKGLSHDNKVTLIQENIISLIQHRPDEFDLDVLSHMQHFLVHCTEAFKQQRTFRHLSKLICVHYLFKRALQRALTNFPDRRYISTKLLRTNVNGRRVLGIAIGVSFLKDNEILLSRHILHAINSLIPKVQMVEGSYVSEQHELMYLEIERKGGITLDDERTLKRELHSEIKNCIETRLNPIFMSQNEEEIMRDIVTLSGQLRFVRDLPQVIINFNEQSEEKLEFLVICLSLKPILRHLQQKASFLECQINRVKTVGSLRKKYPKHATVFRLFILKSSFLRQDHSVDLNKARREVAKELKRIIGEFRDYNGGILSKETELFTQLSELLQEVAQDNAFILEEFFYNIEPVVMRSILPAEVLQKLFLMLIDTEVYENYSIRIEEDDDFYAVISASDPSFQKEIAELTDSLDAATCFLKSTASPTFCLVWRGPSKEQAVELRLKLEQTMTNWMAINH